MTISTTHVAETLRELGIQTLAVLREHLDGSRPQSWLTDLVIDYPTRGGKAVRPALCLATCRAFGGRVEEALPSAAAIELSKPMPSMYAVSVCMGLFRYLSCARKNQAAIGAAKSK